MLTFYTTSLGVEATKRSSQREGHSLVGLHRADSPCRVLRAASWVGRGNAQPLGRAHNYGSEACSYSGLYQGKPCHPRTQASVTNRRADSFSLMLVCSLNIHWSLYIHHIPLPHRYTCRPIPLLSVEFPSVRLGHYPDGSIYLNYCCPLKLFEPKN